MTEFPFLGGKCSACQPNTFSLSQIWCFTNRGSYFLKVKHQFNVLKKKVT